MQESMQESHAGGPCRRTMQESHAGQPYDRAAARDGGQRSSCTARRTALSSSSSGGGRRGDARAAGGDLDVCVRSSRRVQRMHTLSAPARRLRARAAARRRSQVLRVAGAASCAANDATRSLPPAGDKLQTCDRAARGLARPLPCSAGLQARGLRFRCCVGSDASAPPRRCRRRTQHRRAGAPHTVAERVQPIPWTVGVVPQSYARHRALVLPPRHRRAEAASDAPTR